MKILLFSYYNPLGKGGFEKQAIGLIKQLISQEHQVACLTVASPENADNMKTNLEESKLFSLGCYVIPHQEKPYSLRASLLFWFARNPAKFLAIQHPQLQKSIAKSLKEICQKKEIEVIHCLSLRTTYFLPDLLKIPTLIDLVDSKTQYKKRTVQYYLRHETKKLIPSIFDFWKTLKIEKNILSLHPDYPVTVVSSKDAYVLKSLVPNSSIYTVSHPVAISDIHLSNNQKYYDCKELAFYGFMDHANLNALMILIQQIMPLVISKFPNVTLKVTGFSLPSQLYHLQEQRTWLKIIPSVDNIPEFLSNVTLTCWPFKYGTGVKNKILESMAMGKPVVTTTIGVEAFTESQKQGLLIGDNAQALANHIVYLLNNPDECTRLGNINREVILTEFTWEKKAEDYLELYNLAKQKIKQFRGINK